MAKSSKLKRVQDKVQKAIGETNKRIESLGRETGGLYDALKGIQATFDGIRNVPSERILEYERLKNVRLEWRQQAERIESDFKGAAAKSVRSGAAGAGVGVAVAAMGPTAAMGVATTFGVASTGTAISALSGAAATNAALAWLGGGAVALGGGGMAAGEAFLAMAGPVGWTIAGVAVLASGILFLKQRGEKERLERIYELIGERDVKKYKLAVVELDERIKRIKGERRLLRNANADIQTFGTDYEAMTELQQYALGSYVNLMNSSTQLLVNPILGLQPRYTEGDFDRFVAQIYNKQRVERYRKYRKLIVYLANLLYKVYLSEGDRRVLYNSLKNNDKLLREMGVDKGGFGIDIVVAAIDALKRKYRKQFSGYGRR